MTGRLVALLVGIDAYPPPVPPLAGCVNDITAVHERLTERVGPRLDVLVLNDARATRSAVVDAFRAHLGQAGPDDVALFYFSGHGSQQRTAADTAAAEPDLRNETIVLVDSRTPGSWDLADKELATLLGPVSARAGHVLVILDCCHSGGGTRDLEPGVRVRLAPEDVRVRPADSYLAGPLAVRGDSAGGHVLIAACRSSETAKELLVGDASRGALSAALDDTLRQVEDVPTYRDVLRLVTSRVQLRFGDQHPQLDAVRAVDLDRPFLGGAIPDAPRRLTISELPDGWSLDAGAIHGIAAPIGDDSTELAVYPLTAKTSGAPLAVATVTQVLPDRSLVRLSQPLAGGFVYRAVVTGIPLSPLAVAVVGSDVDTASLRAAAVDADDTLIALVDADHDPALVVEATPDGFVITRPGVTRPLVPVFSGPGHAARTVAALEHVSRWMRLTSLTNPTTSLPEGAVRISATSAAGTAASDGQLRISYAAGLAPTFTVTLANATSHPLWCALLDLTETYGVFTDAFPSGSVALGPGESTAVTLSGYISDELWEAGTVELTDQLRVIVSTVEFDPRSLEQAELDVSTVSPVVVRGDWLPRSTLDRVLTRVARRTVPTPPDVPMADWRIEDLRVVTTRPRP